MTHPLPPLKRGDEFVPEILRRDAPLDDMPGGGFIIKNTVRLRVLCGELNQAEFFPAPFSPPTSSLTNCCYPTSVRHPEGRESCPRRGD